MTKAILAPGARIECRSAEWLVRSISRSSDGQQIIDVVGISPFLREKEAKFLVDVEKAAGGFKVLQPEFTELVQDNSPQFRDSLLFMESHLRRTVPTDGSIAVGDRAAVTLLHKDHICPDDGGTPYLDDLDENSHKHAHEISDDLKYALRKSIELIGNETIYWRKTRNEAIFKGKTDADQLTLECLRYMYRLLFLFYIESRPDLGYAPMRSDLYRLGYSLESLREMDSAELNSEEDKESFYISDSLDRLFKMIWEGYPKNDNPKEQMLLNEAEEIFHDSFRLTPLKSHLFDPERFPTLKRVRFRNLIMREVIELMSLTKKGKSKRRGRVSYSQLGINQLGAVYEALLSFRGFFAEEELFEVQQIHKKVKTDSKSKDDSSSEQIDRNQSIDRESVHDDLKVGYFVTSDKLRAYKSGEIILDPISGHPKSHSKGSFIYRLAGRDREKSASYYTPESLTSCLVNFAVKDLLIGKTAEEILSLKICEPAMGSAAFLNEVINQLAQAYLDLRQKEKGKRISTENFPIELQKVKMRLADQNVFGVDLNPVAIELAEVSLWLNSIFAPEIGRACIPWFSQQLICGNSLIGARRQIYRINQLPTRKSHFLKTNKLWYEVHPEVLNWDDELPDDGIFHFLLPDPGMGSHNDKVIKQLEPEAIDRCKSWNRSFCGEIFTESQIAHLLRLSKLVDSLWKEWAKEQKQLRLRTTDPLPVWEDPKINSDDACIPLRFKDQIQEQEVLGKNVSNANARIRLKLAMDYWVALWFWPLSEVNSLPSRDSWLLELSMILGDLEQGITPEIGQGNIFAETQPKQFAVNFSDRHGFVNVQKLISEFDSLKQVELISNRVRPLHWDLEFADLLQSGGFDLIVGNPPWLKVEWEEKDLIGDYDPMVLIRKVSASELTKRRSESLLLNSEMRSYYLEGYEEKNGTKQFLNAITNYSLLKGTKSNLYKCFLPLTWYLSSHDGVQALVHPDGVYDDPKGGNLRKFIYPRLRYRFQFQNELKLFHEIHHSLKYSINVYGRRRDPEFINISNLFHPKTVNASFSHNGEGEVMGIRNKEGEWSTSGHLDRILSLNQSSLSLFAKLYDETGTAPEMARLPSLHTKKLLDALEKFENSAKCLGDLSKTEIFSTNHWNETVAQKDGTIIRETKFPSDPSDLIWSGPHFYVATPFYKTPRTVCNLNSHYDLLDLSTLPNEYLPRTNYCPNVEVSEYKDRTPRVPWADKKPITDFYRLSARAMLGPSAERTYISAICQKNIAHINGVQSIVFSSRSKLISQAAFGSSLLADFFVKSTGRSNLHNTWESFPVFESSTTTDLYTLLLNCLTQGYADLWNDSWKDEFLSHRWSKSDPRLQNSLFNNLTSQWQYNCALRSEYPRRQALIEIDVIIARTFGLTLEELINIYKVQFPVMNQYEKNTWYDRNGRIVFTVSKGLVGVGFPRKGETKGSKKGIGWEDIHSMTSGSVSRTIIDETLPGGPRERVIEYIAPFDRCDRVEDYKIAWSFFDREGVR